MSEDRIRVLIVDDEELARARVKDLLAGHEEFECIGEAGNGIAAVESIKQFRPDLVLLDIQMPGMNGFEVIESLDEVPLVVFATAFDEYAIKAFEVNSIDYLLKPITKERFAEALTRASDLLHEEIGLEQTIGRIAELVQPAGLNRLPVTKGKRIVLLDAGDVVWVEASDELVFVHTKSDRYLINMTMSELEQRLDAKTFFRTHRSSIVNLDHVVEIVPWFGGKYQVVVADDAKTEVVLSRARARRLREILPW